MGQGVARRRSEGDHAPHPVEAKETEWAEAAWGMIGLETALRVVHKAMVETGLLGFGLMLWFVFLLFRAGLPTSRRWEFKWDGAVSLAALLGCTALLVHSLVDFNLQIPANAAFFYVLCALAASRPQSTSAKRGPSRASTRGDGNGSRTSPFENNGSMPRFR